MKELKKKYEAVFERELFESCAPFWLRHGRDPIYGGVANCLDREGRLYSTDKSVWMQGRTAYTYSHLYNTFEKNPEWLAFAADCLGFLKAHCFDEDGRMFFTVTQDGRPLRKRRYWFSESFFCIGSLEYAKATGDATALLDARRTFSLIYDIYRDPTKDPYKITPKSYGTTRSLVSLAAPMILLNVSSLMRGADPENAKVYDRAIDGLIADIHRHHHEGLACMLESVPKGGGYLADAAEGRIVNPGHDMECAWFLLEEGIHRNDSALKAFAKTVFDEAIARGWDKEYGGILYFVDAEGKPVEAYEHDMKLWWPHNEGMIASLLLYRETGDPAYRAWFERITDYALSHFSDPAFGEWLGYLRRDGKPTEPPCKGHTYKGAFHVMRMLAKVLTVLREA